ncbi:MAG: glutamine amidotransferase [Myxococcota bacterium]
MKERPILVLKTGEALPSVHALHGDFEDWIAMGLGVSRDAIAVAAVYRGDAIPPEELIAGVVVTGSPAMVTERPAWSEAAAEWLAKLVEQNRMPVLGLCYGHQLIAHGLGGEVGPNPMGREMGTVEVCFSSMVEDLQDQDDRSGLGPLFEEGVFKGHMSHVESVLRPPKGARVLAQTALDPHSVLAFGPRQWGVQFHPEFDRDIMRGYVEARRDILTREGLDPDRMIAEVAEADSIGQVLKRFADVIERG